MGAPAATGEAKQETGALARSLMAGQDGFLHGVRVGVCPGVGRRGGLGVLPIPLVVLCAGGMGSTLLLLRALQKWQLGFLVVLYLLSRICPSCACTQLFLAPYSFLVFYCLRRGVSRCKPCSKGFQVPACLTFKVPRTLPSACSWAKSSNTKPVF